MHLTWGHGCGGWVFGGWGFLTVGGFELLPPPPGAPYVSPIWPVAGFAKDFWLVSGGFGRWVGGGWVDPFGG